MKTIESAGFLVSAMLLAASCGCAAAPAVTRGQNPITDSAVSPVEHTAASYGALGTQPPPLEALMDHHRYTDYSQYQVDENGQIVAHDLRSQVAGAMQNCPTCPSGPSDPTSPTCPPNPACPHCHGHPPHGQTCPECQHGHGHWDGASLDPLHLEYPQHHFTYGYIRPKNLLYPPPEVPGGAVMYPYYTHKGPSDFFRK